MGKAKSSRCSRDRDITKIPNHNTEEKNISFQPVVSFIKPAEKTLQEK